MLLHHQVWTCKILVFAVKAKIDALYIIISTSSMSPLGFCWSKTKIHKVDLKVRGSKSDKYEIFKGMLILKYSNNLSTMLLIC